MGDSAAAPRAGGGKKKSAAGVKAKGAAGEKVAAVVKAKDTAVGKVAAGVKGKGAAAGKKGKAVGEEASDSVVDIEDQVRFPSSSTPGLADHSQVDVLGVRYKSSTLE